VAALLLAVATTMLGGCGSDLPEQVLGTVERDRLELIAESNERIVEIATREGDHVAEGALLLRQEAGTAQPRLDQARAVQAQARRRLADLEQGPREREIADARAALAGAESTLRTEQAEFERVAALVRQELSSPSNLDLSRGRRDAARAAMDSARARLELLQEGTRTEQIAEARAAVEQATAALAEVETVTARYTVHAPRAGRIEALPYELGERPAAGRPVVVMLADGAPYARVYVPEPLRPRFGPGTKVQATVDGIDGAFDGTVRYVAAEAAFTPYYALTQRDRSRLAYLAEIVFDEARAADLPTGMPVQVTVPAAAAP
jgi:HlyD family secretion protein